MSSPGSEGSRPVDRAPSLRDEINNDFTSGRGFEVSCRAAAMFFFAFSERGIDPEQLVDGTGFDVAHWSDLTERVHWDSFCRLLENAAQKIPASEFEELGYRNVFQDWSSPLIVLARSIYKDPDELYTAFLAPIVGPAALVVRCVDSEVTIEDNGLKISQRMWQGYKTSSLYTTFSAGVLRAMPASMYWPDPSVELTREDEGVTYRIRYQGSAGLAGKIRGMLYKFTAAPLIARELQRGYVIMQARFRDLSRQVEARTAAEDALRASEEKFRALVEQSEDFVIVLDDNLRAHYLSPRVHRTLSHLPEEERLVWYQRPGSRTAARFGELIAEARPRPGEAIRCQLDAPTPDETRFLDGFVTNHTNNPAIGGYVFVLQDRTEQYRMREQIERASRIEAVGQLASGVAHDFNNYLQVISGQMELARNGIETWDAVSAVIEQTIGQASALTRELLLMGRESTFTPERIDLCQWLSGRRPLLLAAVSSSIELKLDVGDMPCEVTGDARQLEQLLLNLVINARDAIFADSGAGTIEVALQRGEGEVQLSVADNGSGIDDATLQHLFEPFFSTKPQEKGSGLGLAAVLAIAQRHDGDITVRSKPGEGATFRLLLPLAAEHVPG